MFQLHSIQKLIRQVDKTHKGLGAMIAMNIVCAKAKMCILNVAPAGCGKSVSTDTVTSLLTGVAQKYTSLTLAGLKHLSEELNQFSGHITIDDLGGEKRLLAIWMRNIANTLIKSVQARLI